MFFICYFILQDSSDNTSLGNNSSDSSKLLILLSIPTSISHSTKCPSNSHPFDFKFFIGKKRKKKQHISLFIILEKFIKKSSNCEGHTEFKLPEKYQITYTTNYIFQVFEQCAVYCLFQKETLDFTTTSRDTNYLKDKPTIKHGEKRWIQIPNAWTQRCRRFNFKS